MTLYSLLQNQTMTSVTQDLENFWSNGIKPNLCGFAITAGGVFFVTPVLIPTVQRIPLLGGLGLRAQEAVLAGVYAVASVSLCSQLGLAKFL
jgi:hypothetical protein